MWLRRLFIIASFIFLVSAWFAVNSFQTNNQVNMIGQKLAEWSHHHQKTIKIHGKEINLAGGGMWAYGIEQTPNGPRSICRGTTAVYWQTDLATAKDNKILRENLNGIVRQGNCRSHALVAYMRKLDNFEELMQLRAEKLAEDLSCLGQFEFTSVEIK